jgi:hypothetical protein
MLWLLAIFVLISLLWAVPHWHLRDKDLSAYDMPLEASMSGDPPSEANAEVHAWAAGMSTSMARGNPRQRLSSLRKYG